MNKKYILMIALLMLLIILIACQPDTATQAAQNTQPIIGGGCGV